jgi:FMN-dependent NADH-azoreductase
MKNLLHILVSARGDVSHSRQAGQASVATLLASHPGMRLVERDLGAEALAHPDAAFVRASLMPDELRGAAEHQRLRLSEELIAELDAADFVLISTPLHNFMLPSVLKAWIDHIVRPLRTFRFSAEGKVGMLRDKPVRVLLACGGPLGGERGQPDFVTPYLRHVLSHHRPVRPAGACASKTRSGGQCRAGRRTARRFGLDWRRRNAPRRLSQHQALFGSSKTRQVVVAWAKSLPSASTMRPSAVASCRPQWITVPMARSGPLLQEAARTMLTLSSAVV